MTFTEELLSKMVLSIKGSYKFKYHPDPDAPEKEITIDFTPPFNRIPMMKGLEMEINKMGEETKDFHTFPTND